MVAAACALVLLALLPTTGTAAAAGAAPKPHLLFALVDDLGHFNVELHNPEMKTPHLVEFRKAGLLLDRHYTYKYCSPTRVSIMSGRLPIHVKEDNDWVGGVPRNMTIIAAVLKRAGYATHQIGKWHAGAASHGHVPAGRGFDTSLGYLHCCEDHFSQKVSGATDYWKTQEPAYGLNGTGSGEAGDGAGYCTYNYVAEAKRVLAAHEPTTPLYIYMAFHNNHGPLEVTDYYKGQYPVSPTMVNSRATYNGMTTAWDDGLKNITDVYRSKGMWENTLMVMSADNGGPIYGGGAANNYPLRGGKMSNWEGGVRTVALLSGGFLPPALYGKTAPGYIHICDWYSTFAGLAGVDPTDMLAAANHLPPIDSINMWPYITSLANDDIYSDPLKSRSPRLLLPLGSADHHADDASGAIIRTIDHIKLIYGPKICEDIWTGEIYPNQTWGLDEAQAKSAHLLPLSLVAAAAGAPGKLNGPFPGLGNPGTRRCGTSDGAHDKTSPMCNGTTSDGRLYLPLAEMQSRCSADPSCAGFAQDSADAGGSYFRPLPTITVIVAKGFSLKWQTWTKGARPPPGPAPGPAPPAPPAPAPGPAPPAPGPPHPSHGNPRVQCSSCAHGCMFNISSDPNEHVDLAKDPAHAALLREMVALFNKSVTATVWQWGTVEQYNSSAMHEAMLGYGGYWGPYLPK